VVWLAPRALRDCAPSAPWASASAWPLNFTVRRLMLRRFLIAMGLGVVAAGTADVTPVSAGITSPIELPPVQAARCKEIAASKGPEHEDCVRAAQILALMSAESRDVRWADAIEPFLRKWIESLQPDEFTFRKVECRRSWCLLEVGSTIAAGDRPGHSLILATHEAQKRKIFQLQTLFAHDFDDQSVWDALVIFKRYCSESELFDGNGHLAPDFYTLGQTC